jgi:exosortase
VQIAIRPSLINFLTRNWLLLAGIVAIFVPTMALVAKTSWGTEAGAHGPLVVATGIWLIARKWDAVLALRAPPPSWQVLGLFVPLAFLYYFGSISQIVEVQGYLMYALILIVLFSFVGLRALLVVTFPVIYLLFAFPPPNTLVAAITQPLKIWISQAAINILYQFGYPVAGAGVTIQVGQYQLLVAAACSGLNSLISLSAISLFYVYLRHQLHWRYAGFLMLAIIPVAIFANLIRVLILILLTYHAGESVAQGFLHNFAGLTMFVTALLTIFAVDYFAEPIWRRFAGK